MHQVELTKHAMQRLAQRGFESSDVDVILAIGTAVEDGYLVRRKDCEAAERALRRLLSRIRKLQGKRLVVSDGALVTAYHASPAEERRLLRAH